MKIFSSLTTSSSGSQPLRRWGLSAALASLGALGLAAWAAPEMDDHHAGCHHEWHRPGPGERARHLDHLLREIQASDAQRAQIKSIEEAADKDLKAQHEAGRAAHEKLADLLAQPTLDEAAIESQRQQLLAQHDAASKRITQSMIDIAKVLTPQQRQDLAAKFKQEHEKMGARQEPWKHEHDDAAAPAAPSASS